MGSRKVNTEGIDEELLKGSGIREFSEEISDIIRPQ
jgi:hypothetical protein